MRGLSDVGRVYLHREFVDFRKAINGLVVLIEQSMQLSPYEDAVFVFCNRGRDKLKILYWDRTGFCLWYKRLEKDRFKWPNQLNDKVVTLTSAQLGWLLRGLSVVEHQALHYSS